MAIVRLSIEVLQGARGADSEESRAIAVAELADLQARVRSIAGIHVYGPEDTAPWGVPRRPDTFNLDFDTVLSAESQGDHDALGLIASYLLAE